MRFDPTKIRAVSIDLNGTILSPNPSVGDIYADVLRGFGYTLTPELIEDAFRGAFREVQAVWSKYPERRMDISFWREVVDGTAAEIQGWDAVSDEVFDALFHTFEEANRWSIREGTFDFLDALTEKDLILTFFSNTDARMHKVLEATHLAEYANVLSLSCDLGFEKPAPEAFNAVEQQLDCKPIEILHIGDSLINDGKGPYKAGWQCALQKSDKTENQGFATFTELNDILSLFI
ncbi:MAG: HAD-IA family hydrolase [Opitutales bacterium]